MYKRNCKWNMFSTHIFIYNNIFLKGAFYKFISVFTKISLFIVNIVIHIWVASITKSLNLPITNVRKKIFENIGIFLPIMSNTSQN